MRAVAVCLLALVLVALATVADARKAPRGAELTLDYTFERYMRDFNKPYVRGSGEYVRREAEFKRTLASIIEHNSNPKRAYTKGVNHMSDWTAAEFKTVRGTRFSPDHVSEYEKPFKAKGVSVPDSLDWRTAQPAVLTSVKDQGMCGDCWAHAVTEAVESAYARATGNLFVLSQQQVTSCTPQVSTCFGCDGFYPKYAYDFIASKGANSSFGLVEEWWYSFTSWFGDSGECRTNRTKPIVPGAHAGVVIEGFQQVARNDPQSVMEALVTLGPLSILVDAQMWQSYEGGVFTDCASYGFDFALDHAVMLVGYGHDAATGMDYWIVRNSWSAGWGEAGYIRIQREATLQCGDTWTLSCTNQTHTTKACGPCGLLTDAQFPTINATRRKL